MSILALAICLQPSLLAQQPLDVLIVGGRIIDGSGSPFFYADVGIRGDSIAEIGSLRGRASRLQVHAHGLTLTPGFIDIHSHALGGIDNEPAAENYIRQGVTTVIEGPDGSSPLPLKPALEKLSKTPLGINLGFCVGHGRIRSAVMGSAQRPATAEEIEQMKTLAQQAMLDGAFGLSTGLFYVPGNYATTEEVIAIAKVVGKLGGFHISHMRDEANGVLESVRETIRIGEEGELPTQITHHKIIGKANWGKSVETLRLVEEARARGVDVTLDQYPYTASSTGLGAALIPQWAFAGGPQAWAERLQAPQQRARIKAEIVRRIENERGAGDARNIVLARCGFDPSLSGQNLAEVTRTRRKEVTMESVAETVLEIQQRGGCSAIFHAIAEADVERILKFPYTMVASDGGIPVFGKDHPHPRSYGAFARVLGRYVRERKLLSWEEAVRKMSALPAQRLKMWDRGMLRPGMKADVVILDPAAIGDRADFLRPHQYAVGVRDVLVNGRFVLKDGKMTSERPGRVLYGPARQ
ncbi:MAG: D-aminoacylase [Bryobacteraceae bacterium]|nr:D-aminoacylase [Bryobacteraceae bacterium]MDW8379731.1 D-aminoacylase [Bryobacterales bacterium]